MTLHQDLNGSAILSVYNSWLSCNARGEWSISRAFNTHEASIKKALALFGGVLGLLTTLWLSKHADILKSYTTHVTAGVAVVLALLALGKKMLNKQLELDSSVNGKFENM